MRTAAVLFLLSAASGAIDAFCFLKFNVFTSAMSGNTVLLGIAIGQGALRSAADAAIAFCGYFVGVLFGRLIRAGDPCDPRRLRPVLGAEVALLGSFAGLALASGDGATGDPAVDIMIALAALAMGIQATAARHVNMAGVNTVVFTSTLTSIASAISDLVFRRSAGRISADTWRQIVSFVCYGAGAIAAGFLTLYGAAATLVPLGSAALALVVSGGGIDGSRRRPASQ